jgi:CRP-like cAMP-binding protein
MMIGMKTLAEVDLFDGMPQDQLERIEAICDEVAYTKGELIFREGDKAERLYFLLEGKVAIRVHLTSRPESVTVAMVNKECQSFGWSGVVAPYYYTASALCEGDTRVISMPGMKLIEILKREPSSGFDVMQRIAEVISGRLRNSRMVLLKTL